MSDYTVIDDITDTLLGLLRSNTTGLIAPDHITAVSPADVGKEGMPLLSLFLYQAGENRHLKNADSPATAADRLPCPTLPLQLYYLLSAHASAPETEHRLMGRAMQILHDHSIITGSLLRGSLEGTSDDLVVLLHALSLDDMNKLWALFGSKPYKLSVCYQVSTAVIDSTRERPSERILSRTVEYAVSS